MDHIPTGWFSFRSHEQSHRRSFRRLQPNLQRNCTSFVENLRDTGENRSIDGASCCPKAATQVEDLSQYLEVCREMGVLNASECPKLEKISEEDIKELEQIINGSVNNNNGKRKNSEVIEEEKMGVFVMRENNNNNNNGEEIRKKGSNKRVLKTVITDKWEIFDGDCSSRTTFQDHNFPTCSSSHLSVVSLPNYKQELPDLITF